MTATTAPPQLAESRQATRRLVLGRSEDPRWVRPALLGLLAVAFALYAWKLSANGYANSYYAAAVKSEADDWKAFFFGSLDAGSYITVDKPPMALWAMSLSARIFGFGTWSMLLPQAVAGAASVGVLYATVRRAFGYQAALIAAAVLALTPITVAINRDNNPDTLLVLFLVLAAWAAQRAVGESGRLRWLLAAAFFVGCAFNTKMLQAYLLVPALVLVYLVAARAGWARRAGHLLAAGAMLAASSFWWLAIVDLIPAGSRPYIGGSTDNTVWDLVIGYNGLGRVFGANGGDGRGGGGGANFGGTSGAGRLLNDILGGQISWLLPFAALALAAGLILLWRRPRTDAARAGLLLWGGWLAVHFVVFSFSSGGFHPYYTTAMAPAIAALTGGGGVLLYGAYRRSLPWAGVLVAGVAVTGAWSFVLLSRTPDWNPWLRWAVAALTVSAVVVLLVVRLGRSARRRAAVAGVVLALAAGLTGPAAYSVSAATSTVNGTNPLAGPASGQGPRGIPGGGQRTGAPPGQQAGGRPPTGLPRDGGTGQDGQRGPGSEVSSRLISYLQARQDGATWLVAVSSAHEASSMILATGEPVIAMGGFTGSDPAMTVAKLQQYVKSAKLHYVLVGGDSRGPQSQNSEVTAWVKAHGTLVSASEYGGTTSSSSDSSAQLYYLG